MRAIAAGPRPAGDPAGRAAALKHDPQLGHGGRVVFAIATHITHPGGEIGHRDDLPSLLGDVGHSPLAQDPELTLRARRNRVVVHSHYPEAGWRPPSAAPAPRLTVSDPA